MYLELGTAEALNNVLLVGILGTDGEDRLANVDTGNLSGRLSESSTHSGLQP